MMKKTKSKEQSCHYHVWVRGNGRFTVFYTDYDFIGFLIRCNAISQKYNTRIAAFVILDNHVHLHVITDAITPFMSALLISVSQWLNGRNGFRGKLFESPFGRSCIYSNTLIKENLLYIFSNPMNAGLGCNPWDYKWSSYHFHNTTRKNPLEKYISIDPDIVNNAFPSKRGLDKAIDDFHHGNCSLSERAKWPRIPDSEVAKCINSILNGRLLASLSKNELHKLCVILRQRDGATYRQIASMTHESYEEVRKILQRSFL